MAHRSASLVDAGVFPYIPVGEFGVNLKINLVVGDLDAGDSVAVAGPVPDGVSIDASTVRLRADELDPGNTLTISLGLDDNDGTLDTTFISASTAGQTGGGNAIAAYGSLALNPWVTAGGKYVTVKFPAGAGTPTAGAIQIGFTAAKVPQATAS